MIVFRIKNSNVVNFYTNCLRRADNGYYYITEKDIYIPPMLVEEVINVESPEDIAEGKYCYTKETGFYRNPNYVEPASEEEQWASDLMKEVSEYGY